MSAKFLKGIFLVFGFCFFVQTLWMIGANFGMAEPFCVVVGKKPLKCSDEGDVRVVAKQFCLGQDPFGKKKKVKKTQTPPFEQAQANPYAQYAGQAQYGAAPQGYLTQDQLRFLQQQQALQTQRQQKASAAPDKKSDDEEEDGEE